ncbi:MAG: two pore domain potassium channel family protein [Burkholderiales bacterium]|nr:two pore domain potassium channel family protein [Burkholderiales bacterium]
MLPVFVLGLLLLGTTTLVHFEALNVASTLFARLRRRPRVAVLFVVLLLIGAHLLEITLHGGAFYLERARFAISGTHGRLADTFWTYLYFSAETYTSLGIGDLVPGGQLRFLVGLETLVGLLMISWSGSFIFLVMQRVWRLDGSAR